MSSSDAALRRNDPYAWVDDAAADILETARQAVDQGDASRISDEAVQQLMTAALKLYFAKTDGEERTFRPIAGQGDEHLCPTEMLSACSELLRAMRLGPMELALWYRRRPDED